MVKNILAATLLALFLATAPTALAVTSGATRDTTTTIPNAERYLDSITPNNAPLNPLGFDTNEIREQNDIVPLVKLIISTATGFLAALAGIFAVFMIFKHAFGLITSDGDSKKIGEARKGIINSLLGLLGIMFSYLIIYTIVDTLFKIGSGTGL